MTSRRRWPRTVALLVGAVATVVVATPALAAPVRAATARYVGIVIGGKGSSCVRWHSGITGDEILNDVATVAYRRSDGLIVQIDNSPSSAKADKTDSTHYWSYWHDTSGSWQYSNTGASGAQPKAGSVEGWSYDNGSKSASPPAASASGLYATICGSRDVRSSPTKRSTATKSAARTRSHSSARSSATRRQALATAGRPSVVPASSSSNRSASGTVSSAAPSNAGSATSTVASAVPPVTSSLSPLAHSTTSPSGGSPWPVILGVALVLLLGAGGGWGVRRRRRADAAEH